MRAKLLRVSGEALIDLLHGRLWVRNLPADVTVARIGVDATSDCLALQIVSESFPEHVPYNVLEELRAEIVNPTSVVARDKDGTVLAVGLTRWIDQNSDDAKAAIAASLVPQIVPVDPIVEVASVP